MQLYHVPAGDDDGSKPTGRVLASTVSFADGLLAQALGLMFRRSFADGHALVFRTDSTRRRGLHMLFVPFPIDAIWLIDDEVTAVERLRPWIGVAVHRANTMIELPAGTATAVKPGDRIEFRE